ncbi:ecotropic viral integration site 5 protein [Dorcoceras hygrometricum]|uniref:Ecotropic viral integration site 5 protein n=1 Tax=Dorcoceras hygrometricum TaxID=472368 RepID=A0A2Z7BEE4_9LAMI|nr:ecotropic viral integration site 5 protein [Dorcoceras hygrometricum]
MHHVKHVSQVVPLVVEMIQLEMPHESLNWDKLDFFDHIEMPPRRRGRANRQAVIDSRTPVSADREDASQPSVPLGFSESQSSAFHSLASAVNRAVDLMKSLVVGQTRVQQSSGQSVDHVPSGTSSSQPSVASQPLSLLRFRPRGRQFKRSSSSSSSSGGSSGRRPTASFCGQCGGKHRSSQCIGVRGACNNCVCPCRIRIKRSAAALLIKDFKKMRATDTNWSCNSSLFLNI